MFRILLANTPSGSKPKVKDSDKPQVKTEGNNIYVDNGSDGTPEKQPNQRSPFKILNKKSPLKTGMPNRVSKFTFVDKL